MPCSFSFFFFNDTATTEIYTLSLHDALPICSEFSNINGYADICERFCYWYSRGEINEKNGVTGALVYKLAAQLEIRMSEIADCLLDGIFSKFDIDEKSSGRYYSYLQACLYYKAGENNGRAYSQEPHEDGHFLTFITANSKGLCLHN